MRRHKIISQISLVLFLGLSQAGCLILSKPLCGEENADPIVPGGIPEGFYAAARGDSDPQRMYQLKSVDPNSYAYIEIRHKSKPGIYDLKMVSKDPEALETVAEYEFVTCRIGDRYFTSHTFKADQMKTSERDHMEAIVSEDNEFRFAGLMMEIDSDCYQQIQTKGFKAVEGTRYVFENDAVAAEDTVACIPRTDWRRPENFIRLVPLQ